MEEKKVSNELKSKFPAAVRDTLVLSGDEIVIIRKDALLAILKFLREKPYEYNMLLDLTCVDYLGETPRFEMVYHLFSLPRNDRLRIKAKLPDDDLSIDTLTSLWKNANWLEREVFDLFGVRFKGHPDLRRIFMYDRFEGYPLRKDYPLRRRQPRIRLRT